MNITNLSGKRGAIIAAIGITAVATLVSIPQLFENVDAKDVVVIQSPISGDLSVYTEQGVKWQGFGKVTVYPRRDQFSFLLPKAVVVDGKTENASPDESIGTRFNDGGNGKISGTMNWAMPMAVDKIVQIHRDFGSIGAIEQQLIRTSMQKVIYNVGPTMSSTESSAEKRPEIPKYVDDQLLNGPYQTKTVQQTVKDAITGQDKQAAVVMIAIDEKTGKPIREAHSQIAQYGLQLQPVAINEIKYDEIVEKQIKERQGATTQVQIAIANARRAEQDTITIGEQGKAAAAKTKWEQEAVNAREIAEAEKELKIQQLAAQRAGEYKKQQILEGEGEAAKKRLILDADGALEKKLAAYVEINKAYAEAIKSAQPGAWTPHVSMGNQSGNTGGGANALIEMLTAKTAGELRLDRTVPQGQTSKK